MEFVYVVERRRLFDLHFPHGLVSAAEQREETERYLGRIQRHGFFLERRKAEEDSSFKQIIPYVVVERGGEVLLLQRTDKQGEARLHGKLSIGIGGHINPVDGEPKDVLRGGMQRELEEELHAPAAAGYSVAGFLNDDASRVGSVHFGMAAVAHYKSGDSVTIRETDMMEGRFVALEELRALHRDQRARFETWSALLIDRLDEVMASDLSLDELLGHAATG